MSVRIQKSIRILPWLYLNWGKGGLSFSIGTRGAKVNIGRKGAKGSVGLPGTGIRYETPYYKPVRAGGQTGVDRGAVAAE